MCNRYKEQRVDQIRRMVVDLGMTVEEAEWRISLNIAPSRKKEHTRRAAIRRNGKNVVTQLRWGIVPPWAKTPNEMRTVARSEDILTTRMYGKAIHARRALVTADGFYEWRTDGKEKTPFLFQIRDVAPFFIAAVYEPDRDGGPDTFAILTTAPNSHVGTIHTRMPVIITPDRAERWLNDDPMTPANLAELTTPFPDAEMIAHQVSKYVNKPGNDGPECVAPVSSIVATETASGAPAPALKSSPAAEQRELF